MMNPFLVRLVPFLLLLLSFAGCRKIQNPNPELGKEGRTESFWFFNYKIIPDPSRVGMDDMQATRKRELEHLYTGRKLHIFVREGTIPYEVLRRFRTETGAEVVMTTFRNSIEMYDRLQAGESYDLLMPTNYIVRRLIDENMLAKVDWSLIPNRANVEKRYHGLAFDPKGEYSITYLWTLVGIAYHRDYFDDRPDSWKEFFEPGKNVAPFVKNKTAMIPQARENFAAVLLRLGYSPNTADAKEVDTATEYLRGKFSQLKLGTEAELDEAFINGTVVMAQLTGSDVAKMGNADVIFSVPEEGAWKRFDVLAISAKSTHANRQLASAFINFMLQPGVAAAISDHSYLATTIGDARAFVLASVLHSSAYINGDDDKTYVLDSSGMLEAHMEAVWRDMRSLAQPLITPSERAPASLPTPSGNPSAWSGEDEPEPESPQPSATP